jgi:hypothetical protein
MRLPRWLVVSLWSVSVLAALGAAAWWWVAWPEMTACKFVKLLACEEVDSANLMLAYSKKTEAARVVKYSDSLGFRAGGTQIGTNRGRFVQAFHDRRVKSRSLRDVLEGRLTFEVYVYPEVPDRPLIIAEVKRGTIVLQLDRRGTGLHFSSCPGQFGSSEPTR